MNTATQAATGLQCHVEIDAQIVHQRIRDTREPGDQYVLVGLAVARSTVARCKADGDYLVGVENVVVLRRFRYDRFRNWLLENKTRDLARRTLSSFHSVLIEMQHQGHMKGDLASGITIRSSGRYDSENSEVEIPSDREMRDLLAAADVLIKKNDFMEKCWRGIAR